MNSTYGENIFLNLTPKIFLYIKFLLSGIFGFILNFISLIIIMKSPLWKISIFRYIAAISFSDLMVNIIFVIRGILYINFNHISIDFYSLLFCKIGIYILMTFSLTSSFSIVTVTIDRYFHIGFPIKSRFFSNLFICNIVYFIILIINASINIPIFLFNERQMKISVDRLECIPFEKEFGEILMGNIMPIHMVFYSSLPSVLLIAFNILLIKKFKYHRKNMKTFAGNQLDINLKKTSKRLTILSVSVSISFILLTLPLSFLFIFIKFTNDNILSPSPKTRFIFDLLSTINSLNHVINFIFYCLWGKKFRYEFINLFIKCRKTSVNQPFIFTIN